MHPVVVIGTGPAGAAAAAVLVRRGRRVLVLDAGERFPGGLHVRAFGRTVYRRRRKLARARGFRAAGDPETHWYRELAPGGLSNYWTGVVPRYGTMDFCEGRALHDKYQWPVTYEQLEPYYASAERLLRVTGGDEDLAVEPRGAFRRSVRLPDDWQAVRRRTAASGVDIIPAPIADWSNWGVLRRAMPFNSYSCIVEPLARTGRVSLRLGAEVLGLDYDERCGRVTHVRYHDCERGTVNRVEASHVIVAAGAIESTRILLASQSERFPEGLGNDAGLVGRYLHDHVHHVFTFETNRPLSRLRHIAHVPREDYATSEPLMAAQATLGARLGWADRIAATRTTRFGATVFGTVVPREENSVSLDPSEVDESGRPVLRIEMRFDERERDNAVAAERRVLGALDDAGLAPRLTWSLDRHEPGHAVHYGGTVRMHASPEYGVLDGFNRMHQVPNVSVVDSSAFTTCVEKNPTLTAMALAARAADHLAE